MGQHLNLASKGQAIWMLLKNIRVPEACASPKAIRLFERDPASLRCADVFALKLASVYADTLYVRKTTKDLQ